MYAAELEKALTYAYTLIDIPYRWYDESNESFAPNDKFYYAEEPALTRATILQLDKSIVCAGLINLIRRKLNLSIPKYGSYPGGTVAWYLYLHKHNRIKPVDVHHSYPSGSLLIRKYQNEVEQGHMAVVTGDDMIHSAACIPYDLRHKHKNHGCVKIERCNLSYFTHVCLPYDWLVLD